MYLLVYVNDSLGLNWQSKDVIIRTTFLNTKQVCTFPIRYIYVFHMSLITSSDYFPEQ